MTNKTAKEILIALLIPDRPFERLSKDGLDAVINRDESQQALQALQQAVEEIIDVPIRVPTEARNLVSVLKQVREVQKEAARKFFGKGE